MLLPNDFHDFNYLAGLINALVIAKVILMGEYAHLGKKYEHKLAASVFGDDAAASCGNMSGPEHESDHC